MTSSHKTLIVKGLGRKVHEAISNSTERPWYIIERVTGKSENAGVLGSQKYIDAVN